MKKIKLNADKLPFTKMLLFEKDINFKLKEDNDELSKMIFRRFNSLVKNSTKNNKEISVTKISNEVVDLIDGNETPNIPKKLIHELDKIANTVEYSKRLFNEYGDELMMYCFEAVDNVTNVEIAIHLCNKSEIKKQERVFHHEMELRHKAVENSYDPAKFTFIGAVEIMLAGTLKKDDSITLLGSETFVEFFNHEKGIMQTITANEDKYLINSYSFLKCYWIWKDLFQDKIVKEQQELCSRDNPKRKFKKMENGKLKINAYYEAITETIETFVGSTIRQGHIRLQRYGEGRKMVKPIWIEPTNVKAYTRKN